MEVGHRLIIDGPSTVGKSSVSKSVYQQIAREHSVYWLHEECANHPIRDGEERPFGQLASMNRPSSFIHQYSGLICL